MRRRDLAVFGWAWPTYSCLTLFARSATGVYAQDQRKVHGAEAGEAIASALEVAPN
jgi:hypothetical protein